jgi:hypothetical protein
VKISREELYRRVWQTPVRTLAKEYDISDVGLAKVCRKNQIPLPPVGYWVKVQHGKTVTRPALPKSQTTVVTFEASQHRIEQPVIGPESEKVAALQIRPPANTENLAPFSLATLAHLRKAKPDGRGLVSSHGPTLFSCCVSPALAERVARLLHSIEMALPEIDAQLTVSKDKSRLLFEHVGQPISFRIFEQYSRTEHVKKDKKYSWLDQKEYTYNLSGKLTLEIENYFEGRKRWSDGLRSSLDDKLGEVVLGLVAAATAAKRRELNYELQCQRRAEEARLSEERERKRRDEEEFRRQLLADAKLWSECQTAHAYLARIKQDLGQKLEGLPKESLAWLERAEAALVQIDPLGRRVTRLTG